MNTTGAEELGGGLGTGFNPAAKVCLMHATLTTPRTQLTV